MLKYSYIIGGVGIPATNGLRHMKTYNIYFGVSRILERERERGGLGNRPGGRCQNKILVDIYKK